MHKKALITGASRGIGRAIAEELAASGYDLYLLCYQRMDLLQELAQELTAAYGIHCSCYTGDAGDAGFIRHMFGQLPALDVLVNNAGISHIGLLQDMTDEEWDRILQTNLSSVFYCCRAAIAGMLSRKSGKIINISSVWGAQGASMEVAYSATKGGINAFTRALAKELAPSHIQVNAIACGLIATDMNQHLTEDEMLELINEIPADRCGQPAEVARLLHHLLDAPDYLTGQIITLDGGWI